MGYKNSALLMLAVSAVTTEYGRPRGTAVMAFSPSSTTSNQLNTRTNSPGLYPFSGPLRSSTTIMSSSTEENQSKNEYTLDLSHYADTRAFNLMLEDIAIECSSSENKKKNVDVISRATIAEALVTKLEKATEDGSSTFKPCTVTYNTLMKVWARASQTLADGKGRGDVQSVMDAMEDVPEELTHGGVYTAKDASERGLAILSELEQKYLKGATDIVPNTYSYNIVLDGLHKSGSNDASERVEELFRKMRKWSENGVKSPLDEDGEKIYINGDVSKWSQMKPDAITYSICMETLGQSRDRDALGKIDELYSSIDAKWEETGDPDLKPVTRVANAAMNAYLSYGSRQSRQQSNKNWMNAKKVHEILNSCNKKYKATDDVSFRPDIQTYTMAIEAYARCQDATATERGEFLFEHVNKLWKSSKDDSFKPSSRTFTVMINSWARSRDPRAPKKAEDLIAMMEEMYEQDKKNGNGRKSQVKPSIRTYTAAIGAWGRSRDNMKAQHALKILKKTNEMYKSSNDENIKPTLFTYNVVIDACAMCNGNSEQQGAALKIAFAVNKAISAAKLEQNSITYGTLLKAAGRLLPQGSQRSDIISAVFDKCRQKGYVDQNVVKSLEQASDRNTYYQLMQVACDRNGHLHHETIPKEWTKNVKHLNFTKRN